MISPKKRRQLFAASFATALLLVLCAQPTLAGVTIISFEQGEGFPAAGGSIDGLTTNGSLATWSTTNLNQFIADSGPGDGFGFDNDPGPVNGSQIGLADGMPGLISQVTMELSTPKALDSFWYATRNADDSSRQPRLEGGVLRHQRAILRLQLLHCTV